MASAKEPAKPRKSRPPKRRPIDVFEDTAADAEWLILLNETLRDTRTRRMRAELREAIGDALHLSKRDRASLDRAESEDVMIVVKPGSRCSRSDFEELRLRTLLRQAVVVIAAAVESYVAEKACDLIGSALRLPEPPKRLSAIPISMGTLIEIEGRYTRRSYGHKAVIDDYVRNLASASPDPIGLVFAVVGKDAVWKQVDLQRRLNRGTSEAQLRALAERRNVIAHTADRMGSGRAIIGAEEVRAHYANAKSIVEALEVVLS